MSSAPKKDDEAPANDTGPTSAMNLPVQAAPADVPLLITIPDDATPDISRVGHCGWAFVGGDNHPAIVLDVRAGRFFIAHGTSSSHLSGQLQGDPIVVGQPQGSRYGWPGVTHFYPKATATVSLVDFRAVVGRELLLRIRKMVGF